MTLLMICSVILTGRISESEWNHYTHFGGVSDILVEESLVTGATTGGVIFGSIESGGIVWDSTWVCPGNLSHSDARCLAMDSFENLWIGTYGGGIDVSLASGGFQHYGQLEGLPISLEINCILPDTTVWVGTTSGLCSKKLGYFEVWTEFTTGGGLPSDIVNCIASVDSGLFVGTSSGLVMLRAGQHPGQSDSWLEFPSVSDLIVQDIIVEADTVWAASTEGLYYMAAGQDWQKNNSYPGSYPVSLASANGRLAVGDKGSIAIFDGSNWTSGSGGLGGQVVQAISWIPGDSLMIGQHSSYAVNRASGNGVGIGTMNSWISSWPQGTPSNDLYAVDVDSRNDIWVTSKIKGAAVYSEHGWVEFMDELPRPDQVFACMADNSGGVFIAPWHFGVTWLDWKGTPQRDDDVLINWNTENSGLLNNQIKNVAISSSGEVWFAQEPYWQSEFEPSGVVRLSWTPGQEETASWKTFEPFNGLPSGYVRDVASTFSSSIAWMGTKLGLVKGNILTGEVLYSAGPSQGLPSEDVQSIALSRNEDLYVGTINGLVVMKAGEDTFNDVEDVSGNINVLCFDNLSCLWAGTSDLWGGVSEGLFRIYPDGSVEEYNTLNSSLQSLNVRNIACDFDNGLLYIVTDHGLWKLTLEQGMNGILETAAVYPNPFIPGDGQVLGLAGLSNEAFDIRLFDLTGGLIYESLSQHRDTFSWDGYGLNGNPVASGTYIVRITQSGNDRFLKLAIVR
ncbi:MAG: T9SS type A sorting domain-containing protein [Candidatus Aegiribacteria sp.]|nr:T9SS type A sorting domain-containing protein [Candidatus Aegiribacteria sp.]